MTSRAMLSPAWLGLFAALSFGGLVIASFASGYHLVMKTAPRGTAAASEDSAVGSAAASAAAEPSAAGDVPSAASASETAGPAAPEPGSPADDSAADGAVKGRPVAGRSAKGGLARAAASAGSEAVVRPNLPPNRAVVRSRPETGGIVARLPSNQRVVVRGRQGQWLRVEFDRKGKRVQGWTLETNLQLR
jgi:hypothetical protein